HALLLGIDVFAFVENRQAHLPQGDPCVGYVRGVEQPSRGHPGKRAYWIEIKVNVSHWLLLPQRLGPSTTYPLRHVLAAANAVSHNTPLGISVSNLLQAARQAEMTLAAEWLYDAGPERVLRPHQLSRRCR